MAVEDRVDLRFACDHRIDFGAEQVTERVERLHVSRVAHRDGQHVVVFHDRDDLVARRHLGGQALKNFRGDFIAVEVEDFHSVLLREHREQILFPHRAVFLQAFHRIECSAGGFRLFPGSCDLFPGNHSVLHKEFENIFRISGQSYISCIMQTVKSSLTES